MMSNMRIKSSHQCSKNKTRVKVTLDFKKKQPQALSTPSDFSEYTVKNFPGYKTQQ